MRANNLYYLALVFVLFFSCNKKPIDDSKIRDRYFKLEKNGWKSQECVQKIEDINYSATEVPIPYYILKSKGTENLFDVDSIYQANKTERIVEFEFLQDEEKNLLDEHFTGLDYKETIEYLSFHIYKDFYAVTSKKDTIQCSGATFERNYKITPSQKILLFFTDIDPDEKIQIVYNDRLFRKGIVKFTFKEKISKLEL